MNKESILNASVSFLMKEVPGLQAIYVFGSFETEFFSGKSDLDIAFKAKDTLDTLLKWNIQESLASELKRDVDLVDMNQASLVFQFEIISTGNRVYCSNEDSIETYETLIYSRYLDFNQIRKPLLEEILARGSVYGD